MAKKEKKIEIKQGLAEWMGTYGDMVTLLLCFFILMFATSDVDSKKYNQIVSSFAKETRVVLPDQTNGMLQALGNGVLDMPSTKGNTNQKYDTTGQEEVKKMAQDFKTYFAENNLSNKIDVEQNDRYITLTFKDGILFDSGKADIKDTAIDILRDVVDEISKYKDNNIKIEGHTDNMPINTARFPNNWYLSAARAISVATYFIDEKNFSPDRISTEGYGEYKPKAPNDTPENRNKNRRVEIKIFSKHSSNEDI